MSVRTQKAPETLGRRAIGPLSNVFNFAPMYTSRIPNPSLRVALGCGKQLGDLIRRPFDRPRGAKKTLHFRQSMAHFFDSSLAFIRGGEQFFRFRGDAPGSEVVLD